MVIDFGKTADDYRQHRAGFPDRLFERLALREIGTRGQRVLDLGTGIGHLARGFAVRGCEVVGLDPSEALVATARSIDQERGVHIDYVVGAAERMPFDADRFDGVAAGQSWHWLDRAKAIREVRRVIRPSGWLVIAQFDWLPLGDNAVAATEALIEKYNAEWKLSGTTGLHPSWLTDVRQAGFVDVETFSFDVTLSFTHEGWRGRVRASAGVKASLAPDEVARFDETLRRTLAERFPDEPLALPHCVWAISARLPAASASAR